ncbi:MAG: acetolactate decarboxylase [Nonlabens sp.]
MMKRFLPVILLVAVMSCEQSTDHSRVYHSGALRNIMSGNLQATVSLDSLSRKRNLYALGALKDLKGEIQIFNSKPLITSKKDDSVYLQNDYLNQAALLVWTQVEEWEDIPIPDHIKSKKDLETFVKQQADFLNLQKDEPFVFLLEGKIPLLDWHVIDWETGDKVHTHQKHKEAGLNGSLQSENIQILGFYSEKHKAVFTHHSTFMHMHFKNQSETLAGHVDDLELGGNTILKLPKL